MRCVYSCKLHHTQEAYKVIQYFSIYMLNTLKEREQRYCQTSNIRNTKSKYFLCFSSRPAVVTAQSFEARCWAKNEYVVGAAPTPLCMRGMYNDALPNDVIGPSSSMTTLKQKCRHFDEILITGCTGSCHFDNFQCSQWWKFRQNEDISVSVYITWTCTYIPIIIGPSQYKNAVLPV